MGLVPRLEVKHALEAIAPGRLERFIDETVLIVAGVDNLPHARRDTAAYVRNGLGGHYRNDVL